MRLLVASLGGGELPGEREVVALQVLELFTALLEQVLAGVGPLPLRFEGLGGFDKTTLGGGELALERPDLLRGGGQAGARGAELVGEGEEVEGARRLEGGGGTQIASRP